MYGRRFVGGNTSTSHVEEKKRKEKKSAKGRVTHLNLQGNDDNGADVCDKVKLFFFFLDFYSSIYVVLLLPIIFFQDHFLSRTSSSAAEAAAARALIEGWTASSLGASSLGASLTAAR